MYTCIRLDPCVKKWAVTYEEDDEPHPIGHHAYWFDTLEKAEIWAKAQKMEVKVVQ